MNAFTLENKKPIFYDEGHAICPCDVQIWHLEPLKSIHIKFFAFSRRLHFFEILVAADRVYVSSPLSMVTRIIRNLGVACFQIVKVHIFQINVKSAFNFSKKYKNSILQSLKNMTSGVLL